MKRQKISWPGKILMWFRDFLFVHERSVFLSNLRAHSYKTDTCRRQNQCWTNLPDMRHATRCSTMHIAACGCCGLIAQCLDCPEAALGLVHDIALALRTWRQRPPPQHPLVYKLPCHLQAAVPQALAHLAELLQKLLDLLRWVQPQPLCPVPPARSCGTATSVPNGINACSNAQHIGLTQSMTQSMSVLRYSAVAFGCYASPLQARHTGARAVVCAEVKLPQRCLHHLRCNQVMQTGGKAAHGGRVFQTDASGRRSVTSC